MAEPVSFTTSTRNVQLPLLFTGQAQKEFFLNRSFAILDALILQSIEAVLNEAPGNAEDGACYLVGTSPSGDWANYADQLALRVGDSWHFVPPVDGLEVFDRSAGARRIYAAGWTIPTTPAAPSGGAVIDAEARLAIGELILGLQAAGIFGDPA